MYQIIVLTNWNE